MPKYRANIKLSGSVRKEFEAHDDEDAKRLVGVMMDEIYDDVIESKSGHDIVIDLEDEIYKYGEQPPPPLVRVTL